MQYATLSSHKYFSFILLLVYGKRKTEAIAGSEADSGYLSVGCIEKLKNGKSNYGYSYLRAQWYIEKEKMQLFEF